MNCLSCSNLVSESYNFCPNCGKKLKDVEVILSLWGVLWLLVLSIVLPPFGIGLTARYLRSKNSTVKTLGLISLILTVGVMIYAGWATFMMVKNLGILLGR